MKTRKPWQVTTPALTARWHEYARTRSLSLRNALVVAYMPLAKFHAERFTQALPDEVDRDDMVSAATLGLIDAVKAFEPARGIKFETFAGLRIRGAMIDELRVMDWAPRLVRRHAAQLVKVVETLRGELERDPTPDEIRNRLGLTAEKFDTVYRAGQKVELLSLFRDVCDAEENAIELDRIAQRREPDPHAFAAAEDLQSVLLARLSDRERFVITELFYRGVRWTDVLTAMGHSPNILNHARVGGLDKIHAGRTYRQMKEMVA